jgi:hypothetical protein
MLPFPRGRRTADESDGHACPLDKLAQGLAQEASLWKKCNAPVLYVHRLEYIEGVQNAVSGLEKARVALAKMIRDEETKASQLG